MAHAVSLDVIGDAVGSYLPQDAQALANTNSPLARINAENYRYFIRDVHALGLQDVGVLEHLGGLASRLLAVFVWY
jgi:hypothetical protein